MIARLKALGVNFVMMHCYKGAGINAERQSMADAAEFAARCRTAGLRVGVYVTSGTMLWELLYKEKPEAKDWAVLTAEGKPITYTWGRGEFRYFWNRNHPDAEAYHQKIVRYAVEEIHADLLHFDNYGTGPGWDACSVDRFRRYLRDTFTPQQRAGMGAADLDHILPPKPGTEGMLQCAWRDFCCASLAESYYRMTRYARSLRPDILMECNPGGIGPRIEPPIDHGRLIPGGDAFWDEDIRPGYHDKTLQTRVRTYKIARRMQNSAFIYVTTPLEMAESMAFNLDCLGVVCWFEYGRIADYPGGIAPPRDPIGPATQSFVRFFHQRRELLRDAAVVADIAVLRSFPSLAFGRAKEVPVTWQVEQSLIENRVPFQIVYDQQLDDLSRYKAVVLAGCTAMSDRQVEQIRRYVHAGGRLCLIGPAATRDQWNEPRAKPALDDLPGSAVIRAEIHGDLLAAVQRACGAWSLSVQGPHGLCAELTEQAHRRMVHLVNYREGEPALGVKVRLRIAAGQQVHSVRLASPEHDKDILISFRQADGEVTFTAPEIRTYEIAVVEMAAKTDVLEFMLKRPILGPALPLLEVQHYCEVRVPPMPAVKTAAQWDAEASRLRAAILDRVVFRGEAAGWRDAPAKVQWLETLPGGPGYRIQKLRFEAVPGMWIPALLYLPEKLSGKVPVILNVNGHVGPPGKSVDYKQIRCINQAKRGMLALNVEWLGMGQLGGPGFHHDRMNQLDLCGTSGVAPFYLSMKRSLDLLLALPNADPSRVAVTGLSGGGWQTIFISALDTRVTLANPVAGYSALLTRTRHAEDLGDPEQAPCDLAVLADYTHLTAMRAPRPTLLTKNSKDNCCFAAGHSLAPLMEAARPIYALYGRADALRSHVNDNPGTHNYELDNRQAFYRMLGDFFYPQSKNFDAKEIESKSEVKSQKDLDVPLPAVNEDFHSLALTLAKDLPRQPGPPRDEAGLKTWRQERRLQLRELVKAKDYTVKAVELGHEEKEGVRYTFWRLQIGPEWTVPAVEMARGAVGKTALIVADEGRAATAPAVERLLADGYRVLAIDPFYVGESKITKDGYLWMLLVASLGDRPLGIQASQIAAAARWQAGQPKTGPVTLVALGPRSSTAALVAAALEEKAIGQLDLRQALGSLKEVIQRNWTVEQKPELFCFGLLEQFDISTLKAMVAPREVKVGN